MMIMKRILTFVTALAAMFGCLEMKAQSFEPTSTWPYVYEDFTSGKLMMTSGKTVDGNYNICLENNTVHFIEGELVKQAASMDVVSVQIGSDVYVNTNGKMLKVVAKSEKGLVVEENSIDMVKLNETGGAYGSSSSSNATTALSSLEGIGGTRTNMNHMELKNAKNDGKILPLIKKYYLVFGGKTVFASKKDVEGLDGVDKDALKGFLKKNKIKWRNPESLLTLVDFIAD